MPEDRYLELVELLTVEAKLMEAYRGKASPEG